jgi:mRNA interferase MazF
VISHDVFNEHSGTVIAMALTSKSPKAGYPLTYPLKSLKLPKTSRVKLSQVRTLSVERLGKRLTRVSEGELMDMVEGLNELIG